MRTIFDNCSVIDDNDTIKFCDGAQTVSNDDACAVLHQIIECVLDKFLTFAIKSTCSFVEYKDGRIFQNCAGDGNALPLAAT